jgi:predicted N-acetyltransferase YhbS
MKPEIRKEQAQDYRIVETLTRDAFWDLYKPGCDEHLVLHKMRDVSAFVSELDFVATIDDVVVGNIVYSKAKVVDEQGKEHEVLCMGPLGVLPAYQKQGIGSALIAHSTHIAKEMGYKGVVIFGNPVYYHRFGYKDASAYHITTSDGQNFDAFMALELSEGSLEGITGKFYADPVFESTSEEVEAFEKEFPYREKHITDTQLHI